MTSHYLEDIKDLCNRILLIKNGNIISLEQSYSTEIKIINFKFYEHVSNDQLNTYGQIKFNDGYAAMICVTCNLLTNTIKHALDTLPVLDLNISDVPLEDVIS